MKEVKEETVNKVFEVNIRWGAPSATRVYEQQHMDMSQAIYSRSRRDRQSKHSLKASVL